MIISQQPLKEFIFCKIYKTMNLKKSKIEDRLRFEKEVKRIESVN